LARFTLITAATAATYVNCPWLFELPSPEAYSIFRPSGITKVLATADFAGVQISTAEGYEHGVTNKTPEYLAKFPAGKIPAFEGADGFLLTETYAIAKYSQSLSLSLRLRGPASDSVYVVARNGNNPGLLLGNSLEEEVKIEQWVSFAADISSFSGRHNYMKPYFEPVSTIVKPPLSPHLTVCVTFSLEPSAVSRLATH
jgi:hypothetical protein